MPVNDVCDVLLAEGAEQSLRCTFGTLREGNGVDFTTRLQKKVPESMKDRERARVAQSLFDACSLAHVPARLHSFELSKRLKVTNRSRRDRFYGLDGLLSQCDKYFAARPRVLLNREARCGANRVVRELLPRSLRGKLRPLLLDDAAGRFDVSGLGFPYMSSDFRKFGTAALAWSKTIWDGGCDPRWVAKFPAVAGYRSQQRGVDDLGVPHWFAKTRFIYMMPRVLTNIEKTVQAPLFEALRNCSVRFAAWDSADAVDREMTSLIKSGRKILSIDFKGFDASIPFEIIDEIYKIIRGWFVPEAAPLIDFCQEVFKGCGLLIPGKTKDTYEEYLGARRSGGVPSGSVMTNLVDSLVNLWVMEYTARLLKTEVTAMYPQGDDGAVTYTVPPTLDDLQGELSKIGMQISLDKTLYTIGHVHFLQDLHSDDCVIEGENKGMRPMMQLIANMTSFERVDGPEWTELFDTVRWIQQLSYGRHHPSATQACDWLYESDYVLKDAVGLLLRNDSDFIARAFQAVRRKDSNGFKGFTYSSMLSSPVFQYLAWRCGFKV